jgi:hypothetical protein
LSSHSYDALIGLFSVTIRQALFIAPCSHAFHYKCIRPLLDAHHPAFSCPLCRTFADLEEDVEVEVEVDYEEEADDEEVEATGRDAEVDGDGDGDEESARENGGDQIQNPNQTDVTSPTTPNNSTILNTGANNNATALTVAVSPTTLGIASPMSMSGSTSVPGSGPMMFFERDAGAETEVEADGVRGGGVRRRSGNGGGGVSMNAWSPRVGMLVDLFEPVGGGGSGNVNGEDEDEMMDGMGTSAVGGDGVGFGTLSSSSRRVGSGGAGVGGGGVGDDSSEDGEVGEEGDGTVGGKRKR